MAGHGGARAGWEDVDFPILCESCLGDNPYVRMQKEKFGGACHVCERPHTKFRWKAGTSGRFKTNVICQACAKLKNVCQCCMFDLQYGVPVEVRDTIIARMAAAGPGGGLSSDAPSSVRPSDANHQYALMKAAQAESLGAPPPGVPAGIPPAAHDALVRMGRNKPQYARNLPKLCTFFARGECTRGMGCPFRHEMPKDSSDPMAKQDYKDRYFGVEDPVARAMLSRAGGGGGGGGGMEDPAFMAAMEGDDRARTVWLGGIDSSKGINEADVRAALSTYGTITNVHFSGKSPSAFVEFESHASAVAAVKGCAGAVSLRGSMARVSWAKPKDGAPTGPWGPAGGSGGSGGMGGGGAGGRMGMGMGMGTGMPPIVGGGSDGSGSGPVINPAAAASMMMAQWTAAIMAASSAMGAGGGGAMPPWAGMTPWAAMAPGMAGGGSGGPMRGAGWDALAQGRAAAASGSSGSSGGAPPSDSR